MDNIVDFSSLNDMLYGDDRYIKEFAEAAITSFSEFKDHYSKFLSQRDEENFRKAGHKIKPVAQMLGLQQIVDEYEHGKTLIWEEKPDKELTDSINKIDAICSQVLKELNNMITEK
jgi:HPt (histidine-containing phosphotransfer) domain-containing protein